MFLWSGCTFLRGTLPPAKLKRGPSRDWSLESVGGAALLALLFDLPPCRSHLHRRHGSPSSPHTQPSFTLALLLPALTATYEDLWSATGALIDQLTHLHLSPLCVIQTCCPFCSSHNLFTLLVLTTVIQLWVFEKFISMIYTKWQFLVSSRGIQINFLVYFALDVDFI